MDLRKKSPIIKAVFFDIDGTLVSFKTNTVPESAKQALHKLREKGIKIIVATGRSITAIDHIKDLNFDGYICFNGGYCQTIDGKVLYRNAINEDDIKSLLNYSIANEVSFALMYENKVQINDVTPEIAAMYAHLNLAVPPLINRDDVDFNSVLQANIFLGPDKEPEFMKNIMPNSTSARWTSLFADVNAKGLSKKKGVEIFCEYFDISITETMSFGDGGNDIHMLESTKIGIAMGNANDNLKEIADYITQDADADGIWNALCHFAVI